MEAKEWKAPGPGCWEIENTHLTRPISRWIGPVFSENMMRGFKEATSRYGALLSHIEVAIVNGFAYGAPRPVGAPPGAKGPPPKLVFKLLCFLHPEIRRRNKQIARTFETKLWREDVKRWDEEWRPVLDRKNEELTKVDPSSLDDAALVEHLEECRKALEHAIYRHHSLNIACLLPVGDLMAHVTAWTGVPASDVVDLLCGWSPVSAGATEELARVGAALANDPESAKVLASAAPAAEILEKLQKASSGVGPAVRAYVDIVGIRTLYGYDVADPCAFEVPDVIVTALRSAVKLREGNERAEAERRTTLLREKVPAEHREEFDRLLEEAKIVYRVRDERGYFNDARTIGIVRRALLEAGKRLVAKGRIAAPDHTAHFAPDELIAVMKGGEGPSKEELSAHAEYRATKTVADAPATLGGEPGAPPPAEWLPPYAARAMRAVNAVMAAMFEIRAKKAQEKERAAMEPIVRGLPASGGTVEGVARVVHGPKCFARVQPGDIVVAQTTSPTYNVLLPTIGGIVTDRGGLLSHAAIVAREYGLPAVVGTGDATSAITDGRRVRVDGSTGDVHLL